MFKKGYTPWNKGKTGLTQLSTIGFKGRHHSKESKDKISKTHVGIKNGMFGKGFMRCGKNNPMYGKHMSDEAKKALRFCISGEKHWNWKGDEVKYRALHKWIENKRGKPHFCEHCKRSDLKHRQYQWANISRKYKRDITDWLRLCVKCHKAFDKID